MTFPRPRARARPSSRRPPDMRRPDPLLLLAVLRLTVGAMFVWVFFENLGKDLYTPGGYASLIHYYIEKGNAPAAWKAVMGFMANHAAIAAPTTLGPRKEAMRDQQLAVVMPTARTRVG